MKVEELRRGDVLRGCLNHLWIVVLLTDPRPIVKMNKIKVSAVDFSGNWDLDPVFSMLLEMGRSLEQESLELLAGGPERSSDG